MFNDRRGHEPPHSRKNEKPPVPGAFSPVIASNVAAAVNAIPPGISAGIISLPQQGGATEQAQECDDQRAVLIVNSIENRGNYSVQQRGSGMAIIRSLLLSVGVGAFIVGGSEAANAQDVATPSPTPQTATNAPTPVTTDTSETGDIIVTAQKRAQKLSDIPMSITAVSGTELQARGITDVAGLAKITPGLSFVDSGNAIPVYSLRGVGFFDQSIGARPTVSVYQNEVPLPFSIMSSGASLDLDRVEVLKGPQGTLYGQNATGGAINYVGARPTSDPSGELTLGLGRFNDVEVSGYANRPLAQDVNARIAFRGERSDGWQKSYTRNDSLGAKRFYQGRGTIVARPAAGLTLALNANGFIDKSDTQAPQFIGIRYATPTQAAQVPLLTSYPTSPANDRAADWNDPTGSFLRRDNAMYQASLRVDYTVAHGLTLSSLTAFSRMTIDQGVDTDGTAIDSGSDRSIGNVSSFYQELRLTGDYGPAKFVAGANYARDKSNELNKFGVNYATNSYALPTGRIFGSNVDSRQQFRTKAVFANVDLNLGDHVVLHGGGRYNQEDLAYQVCARYPDAVTAASIGSFFNILRARNGQAALPPQQVGDCLSIDSTLTPALKVGQLNQGSFSWRTGLDWKPSRDILLYANISRGYKGGSGPNIGALSNDQFIPVTQESVTAYEAGFKVGVLDNRVRLTGAAFYYDYKDKQLRSRILVTPNVFGPIEALVNVPKSRIEGLELNVDAQPIHGLTLNLGGTYLSSKVTSAFSGYSITGVLSSFQGQAFPYTPKYQVVGDAQYRWQATTKVAAFVGGGFTYRDRTTAGFGNDPLLAIDGYALFDLRAGVSSGPWSLNLYGQNIFDKYYWTNVGKINDAVRRIAGRPATYGARLTRRF